MNTILNLKSVNSFEQYQGKPLIIWPILGKPEFISIDIKKIKEKSILKFHFIILSEPNIPINIIKESLGLIRLIPLLGINFHTRNANKGSPIVVILNQIEEFSIMKLDDNRFFNNQEKKLIREFNCEHLHRLDSLERVFCGKTQSFLITGEISLSKEVSHYLHHHSFLLFNIEQYFPESIIEPRVLYHAICVSKNKSWEDLTFIHATDLHIAKRNDEILGVIHRKLPHSKMKQISMNIKKSLKIIKLVFKNSKKNRLNREISKRNVDNKKSKSDDDSEIPLQERFLNPNNMLRQLIKYANNEAQKDHLDFIIFTGDLIDFCVRGDNPINKIDFDLSSTNWNRFLQILLNQPIPDLYGFPMINVEKGEELLVPIFTVLGNHDYRVGSYTLESIGVFKHFHLHLHEALLYRDLNTTAGALLTSSFSLMAYYQHFNPFEDFIIEFGKNLFIFLNSGFDSIIHLQYLLMGEPSLTGFSKDQIKYLENIEHYYFTKSENKLCFIASHAPILNPMHYNAITKNILQKMHLIPSTRLEEYKESNLLAKKKDTRSDQDLDYQAGSISQNWEWMINYVERLKGITLNGHTHRSREFHTSRLDNINNSQNVQVFYNKAKNAIYWDDYSKIYDKKSEKIEELLPLHLQTPALGFGNESDNLLPGSFRILEIRGNKVTRFNVVHLD